MTCTRTLPAIGALCIGLCLPVTAGAVDVAIMGAVSNPGTKHLRTRARLSDAALAGPLRADAYPLGAAWERAALRVSITMSMPLCSAMLISQAAWKVLVIRACSPTSPNCWPFRCAMGAI